MHLFCLQVRLLLSEDISRRGRNPISILQNKGQENITRLGPTLEEGKAMASSNHFFKIDFRERERKRGKSERKREGEERERERGRN